MMAAEETMQMVDAPEEALSPQEMRVEYGAAILKWGAIANGVLSVVILVLAFLGGIRLIPSLFLTLHSILLGRTAGGDDASVAAVILLIQLNIGFMLVV